MTLCYYVTAHGFGHAIRTAQILRSLPPGLPLILRTTVPERLFHEEVPGRAFKYAPAEFDCGCIQSDSVTVLTRATMDRYRELSAQNQLRLKDEIDFLHANHVQAVVSDIASFPLRAASEAGIPGFAVANFTWYDIYQGYVQNDQDEAILSAMASEYGAATKAFITPLSTSEATAPFARFDQVPLVARRGNHVRKQLMDRFGYNSRYALLYLGPWGMEINWQAVSALKEWRFLTFDLPPTAADNVVTLDRKEWAYADIAASVDAVISKAGYGTVTECIANSVPLVYLPRKDFGEYQALVDGMTKWGGGLHISEEDFHAGRWRQTLSAAITAEMSSKAYSTHGAEVIAGRLSDYV